MTTAIIVATAASHDPAGGPCALLQAGDTTLMGRLVDQLRLLGVARATVLTRTGWAGAVAEAVPNGTAVVAVDSLAADAQAVAGAIEAAPGETTLLLDADVACHTGAITGLLWDPKIESGALTSRARRFASHPEITIARGRIAHAASPFHSAPSPNSRSLGVVKIGPGQAADVAAALRTVASTAFAESPGIRERIDRRSRGYLSSFTAREAGHVVGLDIVRRHPDLDWLPTPVEIEDEVDRRFCVEVVRRRDEDQRAIVDVVLVALVRSGTTVRPAYLRSFAFARPRSACAAIAAIEAQDVLDEDAITLRNAVKSTDGFFTTFFVSP